MTPVWLLHVPCCHAILKESLWQQERVGSWYEVFGQKYACTFFDAQNDDDNEDDDDEIFLRKKIKRDFLWFCLCCISSGCTLHLSDCLSIIASFSFTLTICVVKKTHTHTKTLLQKNTIVLFSIFFLPTDCAPKNKKSARDCTDVFYQTFLKECSLSENITFINIAWQSPISSIVPCPDNTSA